MQRQLRWLLAGLCVVLGVAGGFMVHQRLPRTYSATASLLVLPTQGGLDSSVAASRAAADVQIETEAELLRSTQVAAAASQAIGGAMSTEQLISQSAVTNPTNSQVLEVSLVAPTAALARDGATAMAEAYLSQREEKARSELTGVVESLESQLEELNARLQENSAAIAAATADPGLRALTESQRSLLVDQIADINGRLVALRYRTTSGGEIITAAELPLRPKSPVLLINVGAGLLVGGLLAGGVLLLTDRARQRTKHPMGAEPSWSGVLGTLSVEGGGGSGRVARMHREALTRLRDRIASHVGDNAPLVVAGVGDPLLRAKAAFELTQSWADTGTGVLVVTEPEARGAVAMPPPEAPGLADVLAGRVSAVDAAAAVPGSGARIVGPGRDVTGVGEDPPPERLVAVWSELGRDFGTVVVPTASPLHSALARTVVQTAGRIVVLAEAQLSESIELTSLLQELDILGLSERVVGVVLLSREPDWTVALERETSPVIVEALP